MQWIRAHQHPTNNSCVVCRYDGAPWVEPYLDGTITMIKVDFMI